MSRDNRLSDVLHILLHLVHGAGPMTSDVLAKAMRTNPVVIRRTMAGLRNHGLVTSEKGHGGGWTLVCDPSKVTLRDVYVALGEPTLFAIGNRLEAPSCLVEKSVNSHLKDAVWNAEQVLLKSFEEVTLAMLSDDVLTRVKRRGTLDVKRSHGGST